MRIEINPNFPVNNCKICGTRPVIEQTKDRWIIVCPTPACKNQVADKFVNFNEWNKQNP
ncbi:hypothetical protein [Mucilaginibacter celer]|uniref:hypothetical protein n=1 Tax=Mucilaginibacter celer TaxID=2305508 RepID=UPI0013CEB8D4|nr:hypothetical protein [Mucilaginibacter celer]